MIQFLAGFIVGLALCYAMNLIDELHITIQNKVHEEFNDEDMGLVMFDAPSVPFWPGKIIQYGEADEKGLRKEEKMNKERW